MIISPEIVTIILMGLGQLLALWEFFIRQNEKGEERRIKIESRITALETSLKAEQRKIKTMETAILGCPQREKAGHCPALD